jgi:hypothetical protein
VHTWLVPCRESEALLAQARTQIEPIVASDPQAIAVHPCGTSREVVDVLTITRTGRLAVLELKASEHIHLSLQAADYWLRVRRHLELGEFRSCGYFPGVQIQEASPLVYLVAPASRFHPVTGILLGALSPQIEVVRVGLTESWRRGIRVVMRQ